MIREKFLHLKNVVVTSNLSTFNFSGTYRGYENIEVHTDGDSNTEIYQCIVNCIKFIRIVYIKYLELVGCLLNMFEF